MILVAATLSSGPACIGSTMSHASASGLPASLTIATVIAPGGLRHRGGLDDVRAAAGLRDGEEQLVAQRQSLVDRSMRCSARRRQTGMPRWRSIRCLPKVAACAELPRAQVTTTLRRLAPQRAPRARRSAAASAAPGAATPAGPRATPRAIRVDSPSLTCVHSSRRRLRRGGTRQQQGTVERVAQRRDEVPPDDRRTAGLRHAAPGRRSATGAARRARPGASRSRR